MKILTKNWDPCCETQGPWKSKTSWGIILYSQVLTANKVENSFNKVITVRTRLKLTYWWIYLDFPVGPQWSFWDVDSDVPMRLTQGRGEEVSPHFRGAPPWCCWATTHAAPSTALCLSHCSGAGWDLLPTLLSLSAFASDFSSLPKSFWLSVKLLLWIQVSYASYKWQ